MGRKVDGERHGALSVAMMMNWRVKIGLRFILMGFRLMFPGGKKKGRNNMTYTNPQVTYGDAVKTKTSIFAAIGATLAIGALWMNVISGSAPVDPKLIADTLALVGLWAAVVAGRQAIAKGPAVGK